MLITDVNEVLEGTGGGMREICACHAEELQSLISPLECLSDFKGSLGGE